MDKLKFKREKLLAAVRENRDKHKREYEEALAGYRDEAITQFGQQVDSLRKTMEKYAAEAKKWEGYRDAGQIDCDPSEGIHVPLQKPQQYLKDYDRVIRMLEMSHEDEITLDHQEFSQYVQDDWKWKEQFSNTTALYGNKLRK